MTHKVCIIIIQLDLVRKSHCSSLMHILYCYKRVVSTKESQPPWRLETNNSVSPTDNEYTYIIYIYV